MLDKDFKKIRNDDRYDADNDVYNLINKILAEDYKYEYKRISNR